MKITEWKKLIKKMDVRTLMELELSLHTLLSWVGFKDEFGWTGLDTIKTLIRCELNDRKIPWGEVQIILTKTMLELNKHGIADN